MGDIEDENDIDNDDDDHDDDDDDDDNDDNGKPMVGDLLVVVSRHREPAVLMLIGNCFTKIQRW